MAFRLFASTSKLEAIQMGKDGKEAWIAQVFWFVFYFLYDTTSSAGACGAVLSRDGCSDHCGYVTYRDQSAHVVACSCRQEAMLQHPVAAAVGMLNNATCNLGGNAQQMQLCTTGMCRPEVQR